MSTTLTGCDRCRDSGHPGYVARYRPAPRRCTGCGTAMVERTDTTERPRGGHNPTWCPRCWWMAIPEYDGHERCACNPSSSSAARNPCAEVELRERPLPTLVCRV